MLSRLAPAVLLAFLATPAVAQSCREVGALSERINRNLAEFSRVTSVPDSQQEPGEACRLFLQIRRDLNVVLSAIDYHAGQCGVRPSVIRTLRGNQADLSTITRCDGR